MNQSLRLLWQLPKHFAGQSIRLDSICDTPWQEFQTMPPNAQLFYVRSVLDEYSPTPPKDETILTAIGNKRHYRALCSEFRFLEAGTDIRNYWIYSLGEKQIVGNFEARRPLDEAQESKALIISYDVIKNCRGHGYAPAATQLFTHNIAERGLAGHFYADASRSRAGRSSVRVLKKAGFHEIPRGNITPNGEADEAERQFALELPIRKKMRAAKRYDR